MTEHNISPYAIPGVKVGKLSFNKIIEAVCEYYHIPLKILMGEIKERDRDSVFVRHICAYYLRFYKVASYEKIGHFFKKHHSTIIHSERMIKNFISINDKRTMIDINNINKILINK